MRDREMLQSRDLIQRRRVENILQDAVKSPLVVVAASPGHGKTSAVSSFVANTKEQVIWLHLTALDNHPTRFWRLFVQGVRTWRPQFAARLETDGFPASTPAAHRFLEDFSAEIYNSARMILVFDNFDCLSRSGAYDFVEQLIEAQIENLSTVLLSHAQVNITLFGTVKPVLLTDRHLRFTPEELRVYYTALGIRLSGEELDRVFRLTDGWAMGVRMLGVHLQKNATLSAKNIDAAVLNMFDLFDREIYELLPKHLQKALLQLSLLESFSVEMATEITKLKVGEAAEMVRGIELVGYRPETSRYYFHQLFQNYLQGKRTQLMGPGEKASFLARAGAWCEANSRPFEALQYYYNGGHYDSIARFLSSMDYNFPDPDLCAEALAVLEQLPRAYLEQNFQLRLIQIVMRFVCRQDDKAEQELGSLLDDLSNGPSTPQSESIAGECMLLQAFYSIRSKDECYMPLLKSAAERLPQGSRVFKRGLPPFISNHGAIPIIRSQAGELHRICDLLLSGAPYREGLTNGYGGGWEQLAASEAAYYRGELQQSEQLAYEALPKALEQEQWDIVCGCYYFLMRGAVAGGRLDDVEAHLNHMGGYAQYLAGYDSFVMVDIARSGLHMKFGLLSKVAPWVRDATLRPGADSDRDCGRELVIKAGYQFCSGRYYDALAFIDRALTVCVNTGQWFPGFKLQILRALAFDALGQSAIAAKTLQVAAEISTGNEIIMPYVEYGAHMRKLIAHVQDLSERARDFPDGWLDMIRGKSGTYEKRFARLKKAYFVRHGMEPGLLDKLTDRERSVLYLVCQGLTNEEIGQELDMPLTAVAGTLKRIYPKLKAVNRADAVRIATLELASEKND